MSCSNLSGILSELRTSQMKIKKEIAFNDYKEEALKNLKIEIDEIMKKACIALKVSSLYYIVLYKKFDLENEFSTYIEVFPAYFTKVLSSDEVTSHNTRINDRLMIVKDEENTNYINFAKYLYDNPEIFKEKIESYLAKYPKLKTMLFVSVVPSIFKFCITKEYTEKFKEFFKLLNPECKEHAILFLYTTFHVIDFINSICIGITKENFREEKFWNYLKKEWNEKAHIFPRFIIDIIELTDDPKEFFIENFMNKIFFGSLLNQLSYPSFLFTKNDIDELSTSIEKHSSWLWETLVNKSKSPPVLSDEELPFKFVPSYSFTNVDLKILYDLADEKFKNKLSRCKGDRNYFLTVLSDINSYKPSFNIEIQNEHEMSLRNFLSGIPSLPTIEEKSTQSESLFNILLNQVNFVPHEQSLSLIYNLQEVKHLVTNTDDHRKLLELLESGFEYRTKLYKNDIMLISKVTSISDILRMMRFYTEKVVDNAFGQFKLYLFNKKKTDNLNEISLWNEDELKKLFDNFNEYQQFFQSVKKRWDEVFEYKVDGNTRMLKVKNDVIIFCNILTRHLPYDIYVKQNQSSLHKDEEIYEKMDQFKHNIDKENLTFAEKHEDLFGDSVDYFKRAMETRYLVPFHKFLNKFLRSIDLISHKFKKDPGEDQKVPLRFYAIILARPKHLFSVISYFHYMTKPSSGENQLEPILGSIIKFFQT